MSEVVVFHYKGQEFIVEGRMVHVMQDGACVCMLIAEDLTNPKQTPDDAA